MRLRFLAEDWSLKVFSLGVAVLLFLFVTVESATPIDVDFRLEYHTADDMMLINDAPTVLRATLQGPWAAFRSFDVDDLEPVVMDLTQASPGTLRHVVDLNSINPPGGMRVVGIHPSEVEVSLDRRVERYIPVHPDVPEAPALGYEILNIQIRPPRVRVVGPASKMQDVDFITTRTIDIAGRVDDARLDVDLRAPMQPLRLIDKQVTVFIKIEEQFTQRIFQDVPIMLENAPSPGVVIPSTVTLTLRGPRRILDRMEAPDVYADVGVQTHRGLGRIERPLQIRKIPERTHVVGPLPQVEVRLFPGKKLKKR